MQALCTSWLATNLQRTNPSCLHASVHVIACVLHHGCVRLLGNSVQYLASHQIDAKRCSLFFLVSGCYCIDRKLDDTHLPEYFDTKAIVVSINLIMHALISSQILCRLGGNFSPKSMLL